MTTSPQNEQNNVEKFLSFHPSFFFLTYTEDFEQLQTTHQCAMHCVKLISNSQNDTSRAPFEAACCRAKTLCCCPEDSQLHVQTQTLTSCMSSVLQCSEALSCLGNPQDLMLYFPGYPQIVHKRGVRARLMRLFPCSTAKKPSSTNQSKWLFQGFLSLSLPSLCLSDDFVAVV